MMILMLVVVAKNWLTMLKTLVLISVTAIMVMIQEAYGIDKKIHNNDSNNQLRKILLQGFRELLICGHFMLNLFCLTTKIIQILPILTFRIYIVELVMN